MNELKKYFKKPTVSEAQILNNDLKQAVKSAHSNDYSTNIILTILCCGVTLYTKLHPLAITFTVIGFTLCLLERRTILKNIKLVDEGNYFIGECEAIDYKLIADRSYICCEVKAYPISCDAKAYLVKSQKKVIVNFDKYYAEKAFLAGNKFFTLILFEKDMYGFLKLDDGKKFQAQAFFTFS